MINNNSELKNKHVFLFWDFEESINYSQMI